MRSIEQIRDQFPALQNDFVFLENAGGSQVPHCVPDAMHRYMTQTYVQLGASYPISQASTQTVERAHAFATMLMNGAGIGQTVLGPSTTQLITMLAECYSRRLVPGDEIVICETAHEANAGPWARLARYGIEVRTWRVDPATGEAPIEALRPLLNDRTRIVAFPHVSNLLGAVIDVAEITRLAHEFGAKVVVDGVAYAPHRQIDVAGWGVDWYVYSTYKVFGPHMAVLFGTFDAFAELDGPNHFFIPNGDPYKFELGGPSHEACAGLLGLGDYLQFVAEASGSVERHHIDLAWSRMQSLEDSLTALLIGYLAVHPRVRVVGPKAGDRVGTISFLHERLSPPEVVTHTDAAGIGIRWGHMYAYRLCQAMGVSTETGVTRISLVHYNTQDEIERLIRVLDTVL